MSSAMLMMAAPVREAMLAMCAKADSGDSSKSSACRQTARRGSS